MSPSNAALVVDFFFNDTATTEIYTLSLHDALPILDIVFSWLPAILLAMTPNARNSGLRSAEHTSELQSPCKLVCRLLLEKKNVTPIRAVPHRALGRTLGARRSVRGLEATWCRAAPGGSPCRSGTQRTAVRCSFLFSARPPQTDTVALQDALPI